MNSCQGIAEVCQDFPSKIEIWKGPLDKIQVSKWKIGYPQAQFQRSKRTLFQKTKWGNSSISQIGYINYDKYPADVFYFAYFIFCLIYHHTVCFTGRHSTPNTKLLNVLWKIDTRKKMKIYPGYAGQNYGNISEEDLSQTILIDSVQRERYFPACI